MRSIPLTILVLSIVSAFAAGADAVARDCALKVLLILPQLLLRKAYRGGPRGAATLRQRFDAWENHDYHLLLTDLARIRDVEIEDLLGREAVSLDEDQLEVFLAGKTVMVTGAGGSIGAELVQGSHTVLFVHVDHVAVRDDSGALVYFRRQFHSIDSAPVTL